MFTLARGGCDNHICHNKKNPDGKWDVDYVMLGSEGLRFLVILKKAGG